LFKSGKLNDNLLKKCDTAQEVYYAEINWNQVIQIISSLKVKYVPVSKFPAVKRDLALLIDKSLTYKQLTEIAYKTEPTFLSGISLFDVYEGKNLEPGKVSYALSFTLEDREKTMTDNQIEKLMQKLMKAFETQAGAKIR